MAKLILMFKDKLLSVHPLAEGAKLTIGRHPDNHIVIDNLSVSGHHAQIEHLGAEIILTDLGSKNGTLRNGQAVTRCAIVDKDTIIIGKHILQADWTDTMAVEPGAAASAEAVGADMAQTMILQSPRSKEKESLPVRPVAARSAAMTEEALAAEGPAASKEKSSSKPDYLSFLSGGEGDVLIAKKQIAIGKNSDADIVVNGLWALIVGGPAAVITKQAGSYFLRYAGGLIKPKRNGSSVKGTVKLSHADVVAIGPVKLQLRLGDRKAA
ncbi:MAG: FHA domain-containing protein [Desulfobacteraceae bacterium]|nr:FHA domain-containing protein [Desulfobacteraceae bacterium]